MRKIGFALVCVTALLLTACEPEPSRDAAGSIDEQGDLSVFRFRVGDCFNDPSNTDTEVSDVDAVPCSEAHDNEVFHLFDLADGPYPTEAGIEAAVESQCLPAFDSYVGNAYESSELFAFPISPTQQSWETFDDREVVCVLYADGTQLVGSMRGSGR